MRLTKFSVSLSFSLLGYVMLEEPYTPSFHVDGAGSIQVSRLYPTKLVPNKSLSFSLIESGAAMDYVSVCKIFEILKENPGR